MVFLLNNQGNIRETCFLQIIEQNPILKGLACLFIETLFEICLKYLGGFMNRDKRNLQNCFSEQEPPEQILEKNVIAKSVNFKQIIGCLD